ncbi:MAG: aldo/keto reductase [Candidatus Krumholzibacteriota bacterium]|nr:aldo/keto reductase [Candidatus Krumholzibacteriota bacterium]
MKIKLANNGPEVSRIVLGMMRSMSWNLSPSGLLDMITRSIENGISTFDHADIYGDHSCEEFFGKAVSSAPSLRSRIQIITKCGIMLVSEKNPGCRLKHYDTSKSHIIRSAENSLKRLGTDYIDILLIHRPDPLIDVDAVAEAFASLRKSGKVLHFGVSNFSPSKYRLLSSRMDIPLVTNQVECSVLHLDPFEDGTLDSCVINGVHPMAWAPLGGGELFRETSPRAELVRGALEEIGKSHGNLPIDMVALAWLIRHPAGIVPVIGTGNIDRTRKAVKAVDLEISREEWFQVWTASKGAPVP